MSKTFDEGGAKGLLLANLGVSTKGCNIVFDSTLEEATPEEETKQAHNEDAANLIDISTLQARIDSALGGQSLYQLPLVPQLALLRREYSQLKQEGFLEQEQKVSLKLAYLYLLSSPILLNHVSQSRYLLHPPVGQVCSSERNRKRGRSIHPYRSY
jgi:hypothetical protein